MSFFSSILVWAPSMCYFFFLAFVMIFLFLFYADLPFCVTEWQSCLIVAWVCPRICVFSHLPLLVSALKKHNTHQAGEAVSTLAPKSRIRPHVILAKTIY
ncbi:hypothetical protein V6Z96_006362 [Aspergillus fumigatus]